MPDIETKDDETTNINHNRNRVFSLINNHQSLFYKILFGVVTLVVVFSGTLHIISNTENITDHKEQMSMTNVNHLESIRQREILSNGVQTRSFTSVVMLILSTPPPPGEKRPPVAIDFTDIPVTSALAFTTAVKRRIKEYLEDGVKEGEEMGLSITIKGNKVSEFMRFSAHAPMPGSEAWKDDIRVDENCAGIDTDGTLTDCYGHVYLYQRRLTETELVAALKTAEFPTEWTPPDWQYNNLPSLPIIADHDYALHPYKKQVYYIQTAKSTSEQTSNDGDKQIEEVD